MKILLSLPDADTKEGFRDQVMLSLLYDTGARVQELADLKVKDIRIESPSVVTLHGKGNKTRQVPVMTKTRALLKAYLEHYRYDPGISRGDNSLFTNQKKGKLSRWGISYIINKYVEKAKAEKLLDRLAIRRNEGLTTPKQIRFLESRGFQHVGTWQFNTAKNLIDRIAANGWRVPEGITPSEFKEGA